jgi:excinuclease UvrABC ATPase subunit
MRASAKFIFFLTFRLVLRSCPECDGLGLYFFDVDEESVIPNRKNWRLNGGLALLL